AARSFVEGDAGQKCPTPSDMIPRSPITAPLRRPKKPSPGNVRHPSANVSSASPRHSIGYGLELNHRAAATCLMADCFTGTENALGPFLLSALAPRRGSPMFFASGHPFVDGARPSHGAR